MTNSNIVIEKYNSTYVLDSRRLADELGVTNIAIKDFIDSVWEDSVLIDECEFGDIIEMAYPAPFDHTHTYYYLTESQVTTVLIHYGVLLPYSNAKEVSSMCTSRFTKAKTGFDLPGDMLEALEKLVEVIKEKEEVDSALVAALNEIDLLKAQLSVDKW